MNILFVIPGPRSGIRKINLPDRLRCPEWQDG